MVVPVTWEAASDPAKLEIGHRGRMLAVIGRALPRHHARNIEDIAVCRPVYRVKFVVAAE